MKWVKYTTSCKFYAKSLTFLTFFFDEKAILHFILSFKQNFILYKAFLQLIHTS